MRAAAADIGGATGAVRRTLRASRRHALGVFRRSDPAGPRTAVTRLACSGSGGLGRSERGDTGDGLSDDQGVDLVGALVGAHALEVVGVAQG